MRGLRAQFTSRVESVVVRLPPALRGAYRLTTRTVRESIDDRTPGLAAETALFTLLSLPALLLVILGSLGFIADTLGPKGQDELHRLVFELPQTLLPSRTYETYEQLAGQVVTQGRGDVVSIGVVVSLWTGSRAMNRYIETIVIAYDISNPRPMWRRRLIAFGLTIAALVGVLAILPPLVLGPRIIRWVAPESVATASLSVADALFWPAMVLVALCALTTLYHVAVPARTPWRRDVPGALLALCLWLLASVALRAYVAVSLQGTAVYSWLGTPIAVVLWLYTTAFAVLLGAELNAEIEKMWPHAQHPWRLLRR